jgi:hypothetical protein
MNHSFPVQIVDDSDNPVSGARVCLVQQSALGSGNHPYASLAATHKDVGNGNYDDGKSVAMATGNWVLVVTLKGKAPVVQPLKVTTAKDGTFVLSPRSGAVATVKITPVVRTVSRTKLKEITCHVTFYPANELVFLGGADYNRPDISGGWRFYLYGFKRAEVLRREKKIHPGTIVTVFSTGYSTRTTRVWGRKSWVDVEVAQLGDISARKLPKRGETYQPVRGIDIHINDFYDYLAGLGTSQPKSVQEIGIFSHSFPGGPILYDTGEGDTYARLPDRNDTFDFDARPKDFNSKNFPPRQKMLDAFGPNCAFRIWGCSATTHYKNRSTLALKAIQKGMAEDEFFEVQSDIFNHETPHVMTDRQIEYTSELRHRFEMDVLFRSRTYPAEAAKRLKIEVRSGCPGTESSPTTIEGIEMMMVPMNDYGDVFRYFHAKFDPEFNETEDKWDRGFVDYHALQSRPAVALPRFSMQYYSVHILYQDDRWDHTLKKGAYITFWRLGKKHFHPNPKLQIVRRLTSDLVTRGMKGQLLVLKDKDPKTSEALYVQEDGRVFTMGLKDGQWKVRLGEL